jgi:hypothetical protein
MDYERVFKTCPFCGHYPPPVDKSSPKVVDGDLTELDPSVLRNLRGEIARIDGDARIPNGVSPQIAMSIRKRHWERQQAQVKLRDCIAWWAGMQAAMGQSESWAYRAFFYEFGVDVATAQTLGASEAEDLCNRVNLVLIKNNIDVTVNPELYFQSQQ